MFVVAVNSIQRLLKYNSKIHGKIKSYKISLSAGKSNKYILRYEDLNYEKFYGISLFLSISVNSVPDTMFYILFSSFPIICWKGWSKCEEYLDLM